MYFKHFHFMSVNLSEINDKNIFYVGDVPLGHFAVCLQWL